MRFFAPKRNEGRRAGRPDKNELSQVTISRDHVHHARHLCRQGLRSLRRPGAYDGRWQRKDVLPGCRLPLIGPQFLRQVRRHAEQLLRGKILQALPLGERRAAQARRELRALLVALHERALHVLLLCEGGQGHQEQKDRFHGAEAA